jgi:hypothetical protein
MLGMHGEAIAKVRKASGGNRKSNFPAEGNLKAVRLFLVLAQARAAACSSMR